LQIARIILAPQVPLVAGAFSLATDMKLLTEDWTAKN
jgi:hypothetical protein